MNAKCFVYHNAHPKNLFVDDCVKRAISVTTGIDYMDVQRGLNAHKRVTGAKKFYSKGNPRSYVENVLGFKRVVLPKRGDGSRMTANEFCREHLKGRYIISMSGHWSAVINGTIIDTWDCGEEELHSFYEIAPVEGYEKRPITYGFIIRQETIDTASVSFYDGNGNRSVKMIPLCYADGYKACLLDIGKNEAIDWSDKKWL